MTVDRIIDRVADPYNSRVREYFANPSHCGDVAGGAVGYFADQGVRLRLSAAVSGGEISRLRFRAWGCPHTIAAAEATCRRFEGRAVTELDTFDTGRIMQDLAVPAEKTGRILVLEDTVRSLGQAIRDLTDTDRQD